MIEAAGVDEFFPAYVRTVNVGGEEDSRHLAFSSLWVLDLERL
jgi:hypothetical protein